MLSRKMFLWLPVSGHGMNTGAVESSFQPISFILKKIELAYENTLLSAVSPSLRVSLDLLSSGQSSWLQIQRSPVRFSALQDFLRSSGSLTESTQPHKDKWGVT
jgi:hypothetical protein